MPEINKNVYVDAYIEGDIKEVLRRILEILPEKQHPSGWNILRR